MSGALSIVLAAALAAGRPIIPVRPVRGKILMPAPRVTDNFTLTANPASINFNAVNPQTSPAVPGNATATIAWTVHAKGGNWSLSVQAGAPGFDNCPAVPISAVTVSCVAAQVGGGNGATSACAPAFPLSTTATQVAGGAEGVQAKDFTVQINYTLADSWKYIAETNPACSLSLTYTADVQ